VRPRVELHIEELVLDGFEPHQRYEIAEALRARLGEMLVERGVPGALREDATSIDAGSIAFETSPSRTGAAAGEAIFRGFAAGARRGGE
jgi:hypothetical protein